MKANVTKSTNNMPLSNRDLPSTRHKRRQRFGYYSMFAAVPAMVVSQLSTAVSEARPVTGTTSSEQGARGPQRLKVEATNRSLLKRQSMFRLPHQLGSFSLLAALGG